MKIPTDLEILEEIFNQGWPLYNDLAKGQPEGHLHAYVTVDLAKVAKVIGSDRSVIEGRVVVVMNERYRGNNKKSDFKEFYQENSKSINFPMLMTALSELQDHDQKSRQAVKTSRLSIFIAAVSALAAVGAVLITALLKSAESVGCLR